MPRKSARLVAAATFVFGSTLFAVAAPAQGCGSGTFWKRDHLPDVPTGLTGVSVIQGMCEGESAGVVFEMPANMPPQRITQVVAPWGAALGVNGFLAALDVEVYDGVAFSGAGVNMGTQVFSLTGQATANMQVQSHALNTLDTSTYNIIVGVAPATGSPPMRRFAICFRTDINFHPSGTCATGWPANFFTDNSQPVRRGSLRPAGLLPADRPHLQLPLHRRRRHCGAQPGAGERRFVAGAAALPAGLRTRPAAERLRRRPVGCRSAADRQLS